MIDVNIQKQLKSPGGAMSLDLNLSFEKGQFITLYGVSGAGKTSLLRMLAGLMKPDQGYITVDGVPWFDATKRIHLRPQNRRIGYVFQDYALFPNMTVLQNLEYASGTKGKDPGISSLIELMQLGDLQHSVPETLSGGQKQRVALARALVQQPDILLLDEPLSALDVNIKRRLQDHLIQVHKEFNLTTLLVSHDIGEIIRLSDQVIIIEQGKVTRTGTPENVFIEGDISAKFKFTGEILKIERQDVVYVITVLFQNNVAQVIADKSEAALLKPGDKVLVGSKAFNPVIYKLDA